MRNKTMYLTYEDYQSMGGTIVENTFNQLEFEAEGIVNWYTMDRLKKETDYPQELSRCMYSLIDILAKKSLAMSLGDDPTGSIESKGAIASQSNDGVSISYNVMNASQAIETYKHELINIIVMSLSGVTDSLGRKLLYRGYYPGE